MRSSPHRIALTTRAEGVVAAQVHPHHRAHGPLLVRSLRPGVQRRDLERERAWARRRVTAADRAQELPVPLS